MSYLGRFHISWWQMKQKMPPLPLQSFTRKDSKIIYYSLYNELSSVNIQEKCKKYEEKKTALTPSKKCASPWSQLKVTTTYGKHQEWHIANSAKYNSYTRMSLFLFQHTPPTGDPAHNPGMCPDWEPNQWPLGSQAGTQSTEPHQPGLEFHSFLSKIFIFLLLEWSIIQ